MEQSSLHIPHKIPEGWHYRYLATRLANQEPRTMNHELPSSTLTTKPASRNFELRTSNFEPQKKR
jgi:hypothetical protein